MDLMVGLTLGLLVALAAIGSLSFTQITSAVVTDSTRLQQKADAMFRIIGFQVSQAGAIHVVTDAVDPAKVVFSSAYTGFKGSGLNLQGLDGAGNTPDTLRVSFEVDGLVSNCVGSLPAAPANAGVDSEFTLDLAKKELKCEGAKGGAQAIGDGVEDFQLSYGAMANGNYQFYTANQVAALPLGWAGIQAAVICLQLTGDKQGYFKAKANAASGPASGQQLLACNGQPLAYDGQLRRVFRRTFSLRNALP